MTTERGVILFNCDWERTPPLAETTEVRQLIEWRKRLAAIDLIGAHEDGIGYGNLSVRDPDASSGFVVSGSQTGHLESLTGAHFTKVTDFHLQTNSVSCRGPVRASSESLTHGTVYRSRPDVGAVIHVHHRKMWVAYADVLPRTNPDVEAGTPDMAVEIGRAVGEVAEDEAGVIVMLGHQDGMIAFGPDLDSCGRLLLELHSDLPAHP